MKISKMNFYLTLPGWVFKRVFQLVVKHLQQGLSVIVRVAFFCRFFLLQYVFKLLTPSLRPLKKYLAALVESRQRFRRPVAAYETTGGYNFDSLRLPKTDISPDCFFNVIYPWLNRRRLGDTASIKRLYKKAKQDYPGLFFFADNLLYLSPPIVWP